MSRRLIAALALLAALTSSASAQPLANGDFEAALGSVTGGPVPGNWMALGNVKKIGNCVVGGPGPGVPPFAGAGQLQLSTDSTTAIPTRSRNYSLFQNERLFAPFTYSNTWKWPGSGPYGWIGTNTNGCVNVWYQNMNEPLIYTNLSAVKQTISVNAGEVLKGQYRFLTDDSVKTTSNTPTKRNKAFFCIPEWGGNWGQFKELMSNTALSSPANKDTLGTGFKYDSGWLPFSRSFSSTQTVTVIFGVIDTYSSSQKVSVLLVDDLRIAGPGVTVTPSSGAPTLWVNEGQPGQSLDVVLDTKPIGNVTVTLTPDGVELQGPPITLNFTPAGPKAWDNPQTVSITAIDDLKVEGNHTGTVTISTTASADAGYKALANFTYTVNIGDNDTPGVLVNYPKGFLSVVEGVQTDSYTVQLLTPPTQPVKVSLTSVGGIVYVDANGATTLTFNPAGPKAWNVPQTVTASSLENWLLDGTRTDTIRHTATSADPKYNYDILINPDPNLLIDTDVSIDDNPYRDFGEGTYKGATGARSGVGAPNEGCFGFGGQRLQPRDPILTEPMHQVGTLWSVRNLAPSQIPEATGAGYRLLGVALGALVGAALIMALGKLLMKQS